MTRNKYYILIYNIEVFLIYHILIRFTMKYFKIYNDCTLNIIYTIMFKLFFYGYNTASIQYIDKSRNYERFIIRKKE